MTSCRLFNYFSLSKVFILIKYLFFEEVHIAQLSFLAQSFNRQNLRRQVDLLAYGPGILARHAHVQVQAQRTV